MLFFKKRGMGERSEKFYKHFFCFLDLRIPLCSRMLSVSAFSVSGKADVAAAGAITLICSTEKKNIICSFCLCLKRSAMQLWFRLVNRGDETGKFVQQRE